jgi:putative membrane protein
MILTAIDGLCMAVADSVPGVSGGTIAFILGFYDRFIDALHNLFGRDAKARRSAVAYLMKLGVGWCVGMGVCVLLLSSLFAKNIYLMSSVFLGLTVASVPFVVTAERDSLRGQLKNLPFAVLGAALVVALSLLRSGSGALGTLDFLHLQPFHFAYIFLSGMVAIAAMVLPGISGSTVLLIAGVYLPAINAIKQFMGLNLAVVPGLMALGFGILAGIGTSIHFIRSALKQHRSRMIYLILGLMLGSLYAIVMGPTTLAQPVPALSLSTFHPLGFFTGIAVLLALELARKKIATGSAAVKLEVLKNEH